jgi:DnaA family protein
MKQLLLDIAPPSQPTLANFVPGRNVELLQTLSNVITGREGERFVYLWGGPGSGKTHLLKAIAAICTHRKMRVAYFECTPATDFISGREADCVIVDGVDGLGAESQIGLFGLYNHIRDEGRAFLLASGPIAPAQLKMRADLISRLGWGLVYQVHELTDEEKIKAMKSHTAAQGLDLPHEVCEYLLRHTRRDLPSLIAILNALDSYSLANQRKVTVPLVRELFEEES